MAKKEALHVRKQFSGNLSVIASDVTLRQWKCAEQGNEDLCGITLLLHDSTTLEDSLSVTTTPTPLHCTSVKRISALREHMLHVNSGQMWGAEMLLESLRLWGCWCLQLAKLRPGTPESSCFTWTTLPACFFPHRSVWCLVSSQGLTCSPRDVMGHTEHWTAVRECN